MREDFTRINFGWFWFGEPGRIRPGDIVSPNIAAKGPDFDFIRFYQGPRDWKSPYNLHRWQGAYKAATGVDVEPGAEYPFSVKPAHKVSVEDLKRALSSHYEGTPWEINPRHPENNETDFQLSSLSNAADALYTIRQVG